MGIKGFFTNKKDGKIHPIHSSSIKKYKSVDPNQPKSRKKAALNQNTKFGIPGYHHVARTLADNEYQARKDMAKIKKLNPNYKVAAFQGMYKGKRVWFVDRYLKSTGEQDKMVYRKKQGPISYDAAKSYHEGRSLHAQVIDNVLVAKEQYPVGRDDYSRWTGIPNWSDIEMIDVGVIGPTGKPLPPVSRPAREPGQPPAPREPNDYTSPGDHVVKLKGKKSEVDKYQPIVDEYFSDLQGKRLRTYDLVFQGNDVVGMTKGSPGSTPEIPFRVKGNTGNAYAYIQSVRWRNPETGEKLKVPVMIVMSSYGDVVGGKADHVDSIVHEVTHLRRAIQPDAKLKAKYLDLDGEERETVHETSAREGSTVAAEAQAGYYGTLRRLKGLPHPESRLQDLKILQLDSKTGIKDHSKIEPQIIAHDKETHLAKVDLDTESKGLTGNTVRYDNAREKHEQDFETSEGDIFHFEDPRGKTTEKGLARFVDAQDGIKGEETVFVWHDGKRSIIMKGRDLQRARRSGSSRRHPSQRSYS